MTPVIHHDDIHTSTTTGMTATISPKPLSTQIRVSIPPTFTAQRRTGQDMAPTRRTNERRGQKINIPHDSTLQENCSHRIRRRTTTSEATFFCLSLPFSLFLPLYRKCNPSPPLKSYKRGGRDDRKRGKNKATTARTHLN
jgi:hypothetical protein